MVLRAESDGEGRGSTDAVDVETEDTAEVVDAEAADPIAPAVDEHLVLRPHVFHRLTAGHSAAISVGRMTG